MSPAPTPPFPGKGGAPLDRRPWYREPLVWMVIGGPLSVVVASVISAVVAWNHIDPVITDPATGRVGHAADDVADYRSPTDSDAPAQVGRNHASTPRP